MTPKTSRDCARSNELVSRRLRARLQTASGGDDAAPRGERNARVVVVALVMGRVGGGVSSAFGASTSVHATSTPSIERWSAELMEVRLLFSFRFVSFRFATRRA